MAVDIAFNGSIKIPTPLRSSIAAAKTRLFPPPREADPRVAPVQSESVDALQLPRSEGIDSELVFHGCERRCANARRRSGCHLLTSPPLLSGFGGPIIESGRFLPISGDPRWQSIGSSRARVGIRAGE